MKAISKIVLAVSWIEYSSQYAIRLQVFFLLFVNKMLLPQS